jgi:hypothetical protein
MTTTLSQGVLGLALGAIAIFLVLGFLKFKAAGSNRRLQSMLAQAGVDPRAARSGSAEAITKEIRARCARCQNEDVCERWLAGTVQGGNEFCPNAALLNAVAELRPGGHTKRSTPV